MYVYRLEKAIKIKLVLNRFKFTSSAVVRTGCRYQSLLWRSIEVRFIFYRKVLLLFIASGHKCHTVDDCVPL